MKTIFTKSIPRLFVLSLFWLVTFPFNATAQSGILTNDGAWCWFSDPRAIMVNGDVITGWVTSNGTIEAARFSLATRETEISELYYRLETDDHDNPAFTATAEGNIIAMYTRHSRKDLFINFFDSKQETFTFSRPQLIHPISREELNRFPRETITYANPFRLTEEHNRIYCFGRWTGYKPNLMWSDDDGISWTGSRVFITNYPFDPNNRPYVKYFSDGSSKIHMVFTDGHPRNEPTNSVYYACYENGAFYNAEGIQICTLKEIPFEPKDATTVYTSNPAKGRAWIADIAQDEENHPVILYTRSPAETNHEYWYARYTRKGWVEFKICDSGKWFPETPEGQTEREPHYFGGMRLHPGNPNVVYLSRQVNGVFEIERWETENMGKSWKSKAITKNSQKDNVRPFVPAGLKAGDKEVVLWMENDSYIHYTNFKSAIRYSILAPQGEME